MADDKNAREKQARDADRRQRERDIGAELSRGDEPEPPVAVEELGDFEAELESLEFPITGTEIVATVGDRAVESEDGHYTVGELVPESDEETFDSPADVTVQVHRPAVAAAMKRVIEASESIPNTDLPWSQRNAYELTFEELESIDAGDEDEGLQAICDWIVERIRDKKTLPGSRDVRRRAATFCRANGYQVRSDEWLGI